MYSFLLAIIEKRRFCTYVETDVAEFLHLSGRNFKISVVYKMPGIRDFTSLVFNKLTHTALFFVSKQEDKHQQTGDLSFVPICFCFWNKHPSYSMVN